ncbi:hypothetical protein F5887DRAFT_196146 [Amanita rubescens]|nr:hypothetical protein F5887DRAFT_196146 [Amanita rubescens]
MYHFHRPSRAFWFLVGAASAALWIKHREYRNIERGGYGPCVRQRAIQSASQQQGALAETSRLNVAPPTSPSLTAQTPETLHSVSRAINNLPPADGWSFGERRQMEKWEEDKEKLIDFTVRATDAIADMSESTLDTVLSTIENLKTKIVEHRARREKQRERLGTQLEDEKKRSRHLI